MLPSFEPMRLVNLRQPFDHKDWLFELKYDGFRALAYVENGSARLVSRRQNAYKSFDTLCTQIVQCLKVQDAILDGEVVCLDKDGLPQVLNVSHTRAKLGKLFPSAPCPKTGPLTSICCGCRCRMV